MIRKSNSFYIKIFLIFILIGSLFFISNSSAQENLATPSEIQDGDLIRVSGDIDVYIVKIVGQKRFKRLILNPAVFDSYLHQWGEVKTVSQSTLGLYTTSNMVQEVNPDGSIADERVFHLFPDGDTGLKRHIALTEEEFVQASGDPDSIYYINNIEAGDNFYNTHTPIEDTSEFQEVLEQQEQEIEDGTSLNPKEGFINILPTDQDSLGPARVGTANFSMTKDTEIYLSWNAVESATEYEVQYKVKDSQESTYINADVMGTIGRATGLEANTSYTFRVRAINSEGNGAWSTSQDHATLLATIDILSLEESTDTQIQLSWDEVLGATGYDVEYRTLDGDYISENVEVIDTTATITRLMPATDYVFRARAKNDLGVGLWPPEQTHSTVLTKIDSIDFCMETDIEIHVNWNAIQEATGYEVQYKVKDAPNSTYLDAIVMGEVAQAIGLTPATSYTFRLRAIYGEETGPWSDERHNSTLLEAVGVLTFSQTTPTQTTLSWDEVPYATSYDVEYRTGSEDWTTTSVTGLDATITDLGPDSTYIFRVRGRNSELEGQWSDEFAHITLLERVGVITFAPSTTSEINLSWDEVPYATSYDVEYRTGSEDWTATSVTSTEASITNLISGTAHTFRVRALQSPYIGEWSEEQSHSTLLEKVDFVGIIIEPDEYTRRTDTSIAILWSEVTGATGYDVEYKLLNGTYTTENLTITGRTAEATGLTADTWYRFRVRATNESGVGPWDDKFRHVTLLPPVGTITFSETTSTSIHLSWDSIRRATGYDINYKIEGGEWSDDIDIKGRSELELTGLTPDTEYTFRVRTRKGPLGAWSEEQTHSTLP